MEPATAQKYVNIYTEANPNPNSMKFVANFMLVPEGTDFDFENEAAAAAGSPLAQAIFGFEGVERVFIMSNFMTVTKKADADWDFMVPELRTFLKSYLEDNKAIITQQAADALEEAYNQEDSEVVAKIKNLLDEYVRPAVESDGGAINFAAFNEGIVTVELRGSCSGCPSSTLTLKAGIENLLKRMVPEVTEVVAKGM